jgi:hypothetical protein
MCKLVERDLTYDDVILLPKIPATWGTKLNGEQFRERTTRLSKSQHALCRRKKTP